MFWASFNNAPKRIQDGGRARQVTQFDFAIAAIAGVDMRLTAGGIREMHWHLAAEWGFVSYGNCRVTVLDEMGPSIVRPVNSQCGPTTNEAPPQTDEVYQLARVV
jgi:oxalate decarboxylase